MKTRAFLSLLGRRYPKKLTFFKFDRLGTTGARLKKDVYSIVLTLDCDMDAVRLAIEKKAELIVSHHPLLYPNRKEALLNENTKEVYANLIKHGISLYTIHTNFDLSENGMNVYFAKRLGLKNVHAFDSHSSFLYIADLAEPMTLDDFISYFKGRLNLPYVLYQESSDGPELVRKVGFTLGSGSSETDNALLAGCDLYISGDSKHHQRRKMAALGMHYIEIAHEFEQEIFLETMDKVITEIAPDIKVHLNRKQGLMKQA